MTHNSHKICETRTMPQELMISQILFKFKLCFCIQFINAFYFKFIQIVRRCMSVFHIFHYSVINRSLFFKWQDLIVQLQIVRIQLVQLRIDLSIAQHLCEDMNILQRLKHFEFSSHFTLSVKEEVRYILHAETVRNLGIELVAPLGKHLLSFLSSHFLHNFLQSLIPFYNVGLRNFSQRHLLRIQTNVIQLIFHHFHIKNLPDETLDPQIQFRFYLCTLLLFSWEIIVSAIIFNCSLYLHVFVLVFLLNFGPVQFEGDFQGARSCYGAMTIQSNSAPSSEDQKLILMSQFLQNLYDIKLVNIF